MADEDEYTYVPNDAVIGAVSASGGLRSSGGLGAARPDPPSMHVDLGRLRPKDRAAAVAKMQAQAIQMQGHNIQAAHNAAMEGVARAKYALDENKNYYEIAKMRNDLIHQANQFNQSAGFFAEHSQLNPYSPDYAQYVNMLAAKYPGATENKAVQAILAQPKVREAAMLKGDVPGEVSTTNAIKAGWLKADDFQNPALYNPDGSFNHTAASQLAALREGQSVEPPHVKTARAGLAEINRLGTDLTPQAEGLKNMYTNTIYQFEQGRQGALGIKQPQKVTAASFLPRSSQAPVPANVPAPVAPQAAQTSIPKAPPPPTPAPTPISPEAASEYLNQYFTK